MLTDFFLNKQEVGSFNLHHHSGRKSLIIEHYLIIGATKQKAELSGEPLVSVTRGEVCDQKSEQGVALMRVRVQLFPAIVRPSL